MFPAKPISHCELTGKQEPNSEGCLMNNKGLSAFDLPDDRDPYVQATPCKAKSMMAMMDSPGFDYSPVEGSGTCLRSTSKHLLVCYYQQQ